MPLKLRPDSVNLTTINNLRKRIWAKEQYRDGADGRKFGYQTASGYGARELGIPDACQDFVRIESNLWIPEHYNEKKDEFYIQLVGEALLYVRSGVDKEKEETLVRAGDSFWIKPKTLYSMYNPRLYYFYLYRMTLNNTGETVFTE